MGKGKPSHYTPALAQQVVPLIQALTLRGKNLQAAGWDCRRTAGTPTPATGENRSIAKQRSSMILSRPSHPPAMTMTDRLSCFRNVGEQLQSSRSSHPIVGAAKRTDENGVITLLSLVLTVFQGTYIPIKEYAHSADNFEQEKNRKILAKTFSIPVFDADIPKNNSHFSVSVEALEPKVFRTFWSVHDRHRRIHP